MDGYRMSPQQARLWALQSNAQAGAYHCHCEVHIDGRLDAVILDTALAGLAQRHELLRTALVRLPAMTVPLQVIGEASRIDLAAHDLSAVDAREREATLSALRAACVQRSCDPASGTIVHVVLVQLGTDHSVLLIDCPSLWADRRGLRNLVAELAAACSARATPAEDADEPLQYADLAEWQCELLEAPTSEIGRDYWRRQNLEQAAGARLPLVTPGAAEQAFALGRTRFEAPGLAAALATYAAAAAVAPAAVLLAAWQILLARLGAPGNLLIGYTCNGRSYDELKHALGSVARDVPASSHYEPTIDLGEAARRADASIIAMERWQECFAWDSDPAAAPGYFPLAFEHADQPTAITAGGLHWSLASESCCLDRHDLKLLTTTTADGALRLEFEYDAGVFDADTVARIADSYRALVNDALQRPAAPCAELAIVGDAQRRRIDSALSAATGAPAAQCVHHLIEQQVRATPHAMAVCDERGSLTYADLNERAARLAAQLAALGITAQANVALCLERSTDLIVGMLGILKAGAAYVAIDPVIPLARQRYFAKDSAARIVVTRAALARALDLPDLQVVDIDSLPAGLTPLAEDAARPEHAAYVIYTSGSTGTPKGVVVEHRQLSNYIHGIRERLDLRQPTSFALLSTFGADLGNTAVFGALASGGTLHLVSAERAADPEALAEYFDAHPVDGLKIVPSHLHALLASPAAARILPRRCLVLGGEALHWSLVDAVRALSPSCAVFNHYGPTETTVGCLCGCVAQRGDGADRVPLGTPLAGVRLAIVDAAGNAVPIGVPGELLIGGAGVARGYLGQPELTTQRFVEMPGLAAGPRVYRSGDRVSLGADGQVSFIGRVDDQVKVRGYRVEPGEIAAGLRQHAAVRECAVLGIEQADGETRLVAWVAADAPQPQVSELRAWLAARVPDYMVPENIQLLASLPLTANGKIDRDALRQGLVQAQGSSEAAAAPPLHGMQATIAELWQELLHVETVRSSDNFFDLGGNSLKALQAVGRLKKATGVRVTPRELLLQNLAQLATIMEQRHSDERTAQQAG